MITDKIKLLKENDFIVGSYVYGSDNPKDIDVYCSDKKNLEYYKFLGFDPILTHPKNYFFTFQCVGIDGNGKIHYFHDLAKLSIEEKMVYVNEKRKNINSFNLLKYFSLIPKWGFSDDALIELFKQIPERLKKIGG